MHVVTEEALTYVGTPEYMLVHSLAGEDSTVELTGVEYNDYVLVALADQVDLVTYDGIYGQELTNMEYQWVHAKLTGQSMPHPTADNSTGLKLSHKVFYMTDWGRATSSSSPEYITLISDLMDSESDSVVFSEYALSLQMMGETLSSNTVSRLNSYVAGASLHLMFILALVFA
jgi:hypothetical protein